MMSKQRLVWADNAKFIGIAFMLLGHTALSDRVAYDCIYAFHMPLFFLLSGCFASDKQESFKPYLVKSAKGLIVPYLVFGLVNLPFTYHALWSHRLDFPFDGLDEFILRPLLGLLTVATTPWSFFIGPIWFFIALFEVRILFYVCKLCGCSKSSLIGMGAACLIVYFALRAYDIKPLWRLDSALLCFPFYAIGYYFFRHTKYITYVSELPVTARVLMSLGLILVVGVVNHFNSHVEISAAGFGSNLIYMYAGAIAGSMAVVTLSTAIPSDKQRLTIGGGTAIILGLHINIQATINKTVLHLAGIDSFPLWGALISVAFVLIIHIPIINFINKRCPCLIGKRKI